MAGYPQRRDAASRHGASAISVWTDPETIDDEPTGSPEADLEPDPPHGKPGGRNAGEPGGSSQPGSDEDGSHEDGPAPPWPPSAWQ